MITRITKWLFPRLAPHSEKRVRRMLGLEDADIRRALQLTSMCGRMEAAKEQSHSEGDGKEVEATTKDAETAFWWEVNAGGIADPVAEQVQRWRRVEEGRARVRRMAASEGIEVHPLWRLPTARHAACAANWPFGRFPRDRVTVRWYLGPQVYDQLNEGLRTVFLKSDWSEEDLQTVTHALERMSEFWCWPLKHRRWQQEAASRRSAAIQAARRREEDDAQEV